MDKEDTICRESTPEKPESVTKDGGYAWLVMFAALVTNIMTTGFPMCQALLIVEWYHIFDCSKFQAALTLAITQACTSFMGPLTGGLINMFGCRTVLFTGALLTAFGQALFAFAPNLTVLYILSAIAGCGTGLMFGPPIVIIYHYFDKYKSLASGISTSGHSLASFFMVGLCRISIDHFGWRGAMFIVAGFTLHGCVTAMIMRPLLSRTPKAFTKENFLDSFDISVMKNSNFVMYALSNSVQMCILATFYQLSTSRAVTKGIPILHASLLPTVTGIVSAIIRLMFSWISNMPCTSHIGVYTACICGGAITLIVSCFWADNFYYVAICNAFGGINLGGCMTMVAPVLVDLLGIDRLPGAFGWSCVFNGVQFFTIIPLAGHIHDITGDFNYSFYTVGIIGIFAGFLSIIVTIRYHKQLIQDKKRNQSPRDADMAHLNLKPIEMDIVEVEDVDESNERISLCHELEVEVTEYNETSKVNGQPLKRNLEVTI